MTTPTPAVWSDGDPLMTAIAAAVSAQCQTHPEQGLTVDDPRTIAAVAATVARQVLGTPTTDPTPAAPLSEVWTVWCEDEPIWGHFATVDDARQGTIDCWQETEPSCPDYSWRQNGPRLELIVGGERSGVYASRRPVYGAPASAPAAPADRATVLREAADFVGNDDTCDCGGCDTCIPRRLAAELRRLADEAQPTETRRGSYLTAEHDTLGMIAARHGGDLFAWERANPWVTDTSMPLPTGLRVAIRADEAQPPATAATEEPQP